MALFAEASLAQVMADAGPAALLTVPALALVDTDAGTPAFLAIILAAIMRTKPTLFASGFVASTEILSCMWAFPSDTAIKSLLRRLLMCALCFNFLNFSRFAPMLGLTSCRVQFDSLWTFLAHLYRM
mmetsp:Transcript_32010/g.64287  ORF Transcript_32010/g.64287 Transcript_32010/m.64287 type:complete len:127 (-) Transcript_32010:154-534(-)|eukprot:CAMPEP_0202854610 /NCGR_PEP_ID=MMETSP1389-20130828/91091_1 /ASSEMBLY_ACC=CAM_ASM_000865 /TAXON_ID=302021 /ORGANISM="Rhodomonas sp., Strain CCMP768" /LENGTH=126 /DNA_ID=CAMNT_0049533205 /DNA_START=438 /DNA_END=818 /DNA_ORIENTATION=+